MEDFGGGFCGQPRSSGLVSKGIGLTTGFKTKNKSRGLDQGLGRARCNSLSRFVRELLLLVV